MAKKSSVANQQKKLDSNKDASRGPRADSPFTALMSVKDLSNFLNVSKKTIRRMCDNGQIPFKTVSKRKRFDVNAVLAAIDKNR